MGLRVLLAAALAILAAGCAEEKFVGRPDLRLVKAGELEPPTRNDLILQQRSYLVGPFDKVTIDVYGLPELTRTVQVDAGGKVALPLIGELEAAGKTTNELAAEITTSLRRYVRDPQVTVNADTVNQMITVDGEVDTPGLYPVTGRLTLMRSIAMAKGMTEFARSNYVVVFRQVNKQQMAALYDIRAIRQGSYPDPEVYANDIVYVGDSSGRRLFKDLLTSGGLLAAPLITILK